MSQQVLWVTSFARDMYEASGKHLLTSFLNTDTCGELYVGTEGFADTPLARPRRVASYQHLEYDNFLAEFLERHDHAIPVHLGGILAAPECRCPKGPLLPHDKRHEMPCPGQWFNRNFSRWFRKIATIRLALAAYPRADILVWVDSDCRFTQAVSAGILTSWFKPGSGCFYFKSKRPVIETGIVGYRLATGGRKLFDAIVDRYTSGRFLKDVRWDDSYQTQMALKETGVLANDLAYRVGAHAEVIPYSPVGQYITHSKGLHSRELGIMT